MFQPSLWYKLISKRHFFKEVWQTVSIIKYWFQNFKILILGQISDFEILKSCFKISVSVFGT